MANQMPCLICNDGTPGQLLVTDTTDDFQVMGKPTVPICVPHMAQIMFDKIQQLQAALGEESAPEPVGAGVLEQIEQEEGPVSPAPSPAHPKSKKTTETPGNGTAVPEKATVSDD